MKYEQPDLPYAKDALEPVISKETVEYHYGKHEKAYIDNLNRLIKGTEYEDMDLEDIIRHSEGALFNNASQAWNHIFYFFSFNPKPSSHEPTGELRRAIDRDFGSFEKFKEAFIEAERPEKNTPTWYFIFPILPLVLVIFFWVFFRKAKVGLVEITLFTLILDFPCELIR